MNTYAAIAGGGVIGLSTALSLQKEGIATALIDPGTPEPASWGNAGHLATEHVEPLASRKTLRSIPGRAFLMGGPLDFVWRDVVVWLPWAARFILATSPLRFAAGTAALEGLTANAIPAWQRLLGNEADKLLRQDGHFVVWEGAEAAANGLHHLSRARTGIARYRGISPAEHRDLSDKLTLQEFSGVHFSGTGHVSSPQDVLEHLRARFIALGGEIIRARAIHLTSTGSGVALNLDNGQVHRARIAVVAAGAWSRDLLRTVGLFAPLIAERGYHIGFQNDDWPVSTPPMVFDNRAMVVTRFEEGFRATSFVEFGRPGSPPDTRKWIRLEKHLTELGLLRGGRTTRWMGSRPTLPDYLPAIGGGEVPGIYYAVGHSHLGLTLAALTGELMLGLVRQSSMVDLSKFSLRRFD